MQPSQPLLTIAIPTYNRAALLAELLSTLEEQVSVHPEVEIIVSDNASPDGTEETVRGFIARGMPIQYRRHPENVGSDANFAHLFDLARGKYFLLFGDDDILVPGAIAKIVGILEDHDPDIVYLSSYSFFSDYIKERREDPLGRSYRVLTDPLQFVRIANLMLTFISGIIVNRDRFLERPHEPVSSFQNTNMVHLSWILPLLRERGRSICVWERLVGGRSDNSGGYNIAQVFGVSLPNVARRLLPAQTKTSQTLANSALRRWFPGAIFDLRRKGASKAEIDEIRSLLVEAHRGNWRLTVFVVPVLQTPLWMAKCWVVSTRLINKLIYIAYLPDFWR